MPFINQQVKGMVISMSIKQWFSNVSSKQRFIGDVFYSLPPTISYEMQEVDRKKVRVVLDGSHAVTVEFVNSRNELVKVHSLEVIEC